MIKVGGCGQEQCGQRGQKIGCGIAYQKGIVKIISAVLKNIFTGSLQCEN